MTVSFVVVDTPGPTQASWVKQVRLLEELGYASVLVPDTLWTVSPFPALAAAAVAAPRIRSYTEAKNVVVTSPSMRLSQYRLGPLSRRQHRASLS
ncbi:MAG: hypothetical protein ABJA74_03455 [Lapillicoccus sp.]